VVGCALKKKDAYVKNYFMPTVKYCGVSLMLWSCFAFTGPGSLVNVYNKLNKYQDILDLNLVSLPGD
jgi:hypothetical protein